MVRILTYIYVLIQIALLMQIHHIQVSGKVFEWLPPLHYLKIGEIIVFVPILLILAHRTRQMRAYYMRHIHEDEEADEVKVKKAEK
jgi:hypothetical protein